MGRKRQALGTFFGAASGPASRPADAGAPVNASVSPPPYRILYIEDDPQVSGLFRMAIEEHGGSVDVAADGKDGLAKHFADPYDVVVTDYRLPDMTGLDVAGALLADNEDLPVIMVTGKGNERIAAEALTLGITNYVIKDNLDVYLVLLPAAVQSALARARERKKQWATEAQLRESEERFRDLTQGSVMGIVLDRKGEPLFANQAYADLFGYDGPDDILALEKLDILYSPEDLPKIKKYRDARPKGKEAPNTYEFRGVRKDGSEIHLESRLRVITWEGAPATQSTVIDITGRKQAQELLKVAVESMPQGFAYYDSDDRLAIVNRKMKEMYPEIADLFVPGTAFEDVLRAGIERGAVPRRRRPRGRLVRGKARLSPPSRRRHRIQPPRRALHPGRGAPDARRRHRRRSHRYHRIEADRTRTARGPRRSGVPGRGADGRTA